MGLDMYLYRANLHGHSLRQACLVENYLDLQKWNTDNPDKTYSLMEWCHQDPAEIDPTALKDLEPEFKLGYAYWDDRKKYGHYRIFQQCGYWRKANQIHNWFVKNVQNDVDDCETYIVTKEQLEELKYVCEQLLSKIEMQDAKIQNGSRYVNGEMELIMEDGKTVANPEICAELLPSQGGFFFGSTDYDEYYVQDIKSTVKILDEVLSETDWETETICYSSSW